MCGHKKTAVNIRRHPPCPKLQCFTHTGNTLCVHTSPHHQINVRLHRMCVHGCVCICAWVCCNVLQCTAQTRSRGQTLGLYLRCSGEWGGGCGSWDHATGQVASFPWNHHRRRPRWKDSHRQSRSSFPCLQRIAESSALPENNLRFQSRHQTEVRETTHPKQGKQPCRPEFHHQDGKS